MCVVNAEVKEKAMVLGLGKEQRESRSATKAGFSSFIFISFHLLQQTRTYTHTLLRQLKAK